MSGTYYWASSSHKESGPFDIYQERTGALILKIDTRTTVLTINQVKDLKINLLDIRNFNPVTFETFYNYAL